MPSDDAKEIFTAYRTETEKRQVSSSENFDKSILTYSSSGLAVSLTFLKDFVPIQKASWAFLLYGSWGLFVLATTLTISSFLISYEGLAKSLDFAHKYYMEGDENYLNKKHRLNTIVRYFNWFSGAAFVSALIFTSIFVAFNLDKAIPMSDKKPTQSIIQEGLGSPTMTMVQKGITPPTMQKIPATNSTPNTQPPTNPPPSGNSNANNSSK